MSSSIVRAAVRSLVSNPPWPTAYVETIGDSPDPESIPDDWTTVDFRAETDDPIGIGAGSLLRELGSITVWLGSVAGRGDAVLVANAELALEAVRSHPWGASGIVLTSVSPPVPDDEGAPGNYLLMRIELDYERDHV